MGVGGFCEHGRGVWVAVSVNLWGCLPISGWAPHILGPCCLSVTVSMSQSLHPWPIAVTIKPLDSSYSWGALGTYLLPGEGLGVIRSHGSLRVGVGGQRRIQIILSTWCCWNWKPGVCRVGLHLQSSFQGFSLRMRMIRNS